MLSDTVTVQETKTRGLVILDMSSSRFYQEGTVKTILRSLGSQSNKQIVTLEWMFSSEETITPSLIRGSWQVWMHQLNVIVSFSFMVEATRDNRVFNRVAAAAKKIRTYES